MPLLLVWDPAKLLQGLKESFDPKFSHYYFIERMHPNIKAVIAAYDAGKQSSHYSYIANHSGCDTSRIRERTETPMVRFREPRQQIEKTSTTIDS